MATHQNLGQSAWHHAVSTYGDMGQHHGGVGNAIAMKGGRRRKSQRQRQSSGRRQRQEQRQRQSRRQSGGRK